MARTYKKTVRPRPVREKAADYEQTELDYTQVGIEDYNGTELDVSVGNAQEEQAAPQSAPQNAPKPAVKKAAAAIRPARTEERAVKHAAESMPRQSKPAGKAQAGKEQQAKTAGSVLAAPDPAVARQVVYQKSSQILTRDAEPNETFGIGDDMPVYYL